MPKYHQTTVNTSASRKNVDFFLGGVAYIYIYMKISTATMGYPCQKEDVLLGDQAEIIKSMLRTKAIGL